jgi:hypothetical protein
VELTSISSFKAENTPILAYLSDGKLFRMDQMGPEEGEGRGAPKISKSEEGNPDKATILITSVLLGLIAVLTAWSGFQSAKWGGIATDFSLLSNSSRSEASEASLTANQLQILDIQIFTEWVNAFLQGDTVRATFYQRRMRDEAKPAFNAWLATDPANNKDADFTVRHAPICPAK